MKTKLNVAAYSCLGLMLIMALWSVPRLQSADPAGPPGGGRGRGAGMMQHCREMMDRRQKMMGEMKAEDEALSELVARMNDATGEKKVDLLAEVVTQMVKSRSEMHMRMEKMQTEMVHHMMQHMQMGGGPMRRGGMSQCPMMKGLPELKESDEETGPAGKERPKEEK